MSAPQICMSRRDLVQALAAVGVTTIGAGLLSACGGGGDDTAGDSTQDTAGNTAGNTSSGDAAADAAADTASGGSVPVADVPVGEARVVDVAGRQVVVARLDETTAVAYSAACTHAGTTVEASDGLVLRCPNHGSQFDVGNGAEPVRGPASTPLEELAASIEGDSIVIA